MSIYDYGHPEMGSLFEIRMEDLTHRMISNLPDAVRCNIGNTTLFLRVITYIYDKHLRHKSVFRCAIQRPHKIFEGGTHFLDLEAGFVKKRISKRETRLRREFDERQEIQKKQDDDKAKVAHSQEVYLKSIEDRLAKSNAVIALMTAAKAAEATEARTTRAAKRVAERATRAALPTFAERVAARVAVQAARIKQSTQTEINVRRNE